MAAVLSGVMTLLVKAVRPNVAFQQKPCCSEQSVAHQDLTAWLVYPNAFMKLAEQIPFGQRLQEALESCKMFCLKPPCTQLTTAVQV